MFQYIVRRILQAIPQLLVISVVLFLLMSAIGDPLAVRGVKRGPHQTPNDIARLRCKYGLDKPAMVQYLVWLAGNDWMWTDCDGDGIFTRGTQKGVVRGDRGRSRVTNRPAMEEIVERIPRTLLLMLSAEVLIITLSLLLGVFSALRQNSVADHLITVTLMIGYSMPVFLLALMLIYAFGVNCERLYLPCFPISGMCDIGRNCGRLP